MHIPVSAILASILAAVGVSYLGWYYTLSAAEREEADRLASDYAWQLYRKASDQLTSHQATKVYELVKAHFGK